MFLQKLVSTLHVNVAAQVIGHLFPVVPTAMTVMRDVAASTLEEVATWIEVQCEDEELRLRSRPCAPVPRVSARLATCTTRRIRPASPSPARASTRP